MNIVKNSKVVLIKETEKLKLIGETFEVANITSTSIVLRDEKTKVAVCAIGIDEFDKYFKLKKETHKWTNWQPIVDFNNNVIALYRTNQKVVEVEIFDDSENKIKSKATCHKEDDFSLGYGLRLAYARCLKKAAEKSVNECESKLKELKEERKKYRKFLISVIDK